MTTLQPFIGLVQGDACGIGPELLSKLLQKLKAAERNRVLVISDQRIMTAGNAVAGQETPSTLSLILWKRDNANQSEKTNWCRCRPES